MTLEATSGPRPQISPDRLRSMLRPRNVAFVGASNKSAFSTMAFENMERFGAVDRTFLVNPRGAETHGNRAYSSIDEIGEPVDLAYLMVPQAVTLEALHAAAEAGVRNAVILSSGYGEAGEAGRAAEAELVATAEALDMLLLGPNMLGFVNWVDSIPVSPVAVRPGDNPSVALLSQSGASSAAMADFAQMIGVDLSYLVTMGNEAMLTTGHILDFLVEDDTTKAIAVFMETVREPEVFTRAALRASEAGKAIVILKAGASELSARTAAAHTGALVGDDRVIDAVFRDLGVIRVDTIEDMLITAGAAAHLGPLDRPGIGVASISGGACDIIADRAAEMGADLPELAAETHERISSCFASYGTVQNPLDVTGAAIIDPTIFKKSILALADDPGIGVVGVVNSLLWEGDPETYAVRPCLQQIGEGIREASVPTLYINQVIQPTSSVSRWLMRDADLPYVSSGLKSAVLAMHKIGEWSARRRELLTTAPGRRDIDVPAPGERRGSWSESQARELLSRAGVPVVPAHHATTAAEAVAAAQQLGGPIAVKVVSPDILHKSDIGGVALDVEGEDAVREAFTSVVRAGESVDGARVDGALLSPMRRPGTELLVGVVPDPDFGPILAIAIGGVFVEVLEDSVLSPLPVSAERAVQLLDRLKASKILDGYRGGSAADREALGEVISRIGDVALALGDDLVSLEINPLRVDGAQVEALDAVVEWKER